MLELNSVSKSFAAKKVLDNISLCFNVGITAIAGSNGCGKSTMLKIMTGLLKPDAGSIKYKSEIINPEDSLWRGQIGYLPQTVGLYNRMTIYDFLDYMLILSSIKNKKIRKDRICCLTEELNLKDYLNTQCGHLSGGVKQRVGIAHAFINDPGIVFLDEPTNNLDAEERERFHGFLNKIKNKKIIIYVGHIIEEMCYVCDSIAILNRGEAAFQGSFFLLLDEYGCSVRQIYFNKDQEINISNEKVLRKISVDEKIKVIYKADAEDISGEPAEVHFEDIYKIVTRK